MDKINIFISGDFCPVRGAEKKLIKGLNPHEVFGGLSEVIKKADISVTNLECPLTNTNNPIEKIGGNFKSKPEIAKLLKDSKFDLITLANNHIYDQGGEGLKDTINSLEENGLNYVGAGVSLKKARKPFFMDIKGLKLAILNFAEVEFSCANENHGGANPMDLIDNVHQIKSAKEKADKIIVIIHGGHEHHHYPSPETMKRYRFFAENGADVIIAHHTHCIGGFEIYNDVPIFYSLGNFLFPPRPKRKLESWFEGYAVKIKISQKNIGFDILPYYQCKDNDISVEFKSESSDVYKKILKISEDLEDEKLIRSKWEEYIEGKKRFIGYMNGYSKYTNYTLNKVGLLDYFINKNKLSYIKQFVTCQAHRETAKELLKKYLKY